MQSLTARNRVCVLVGTQELVLKAVTQLIGAMQSGKKTELGDRWMEESDGRCVSLFRRHFPLGSP